MAKLQKATKNILPHDNGVVPSFAIYNSLLTSAESKNHILTNWPESINFDIYAHNAIFQLLLFPCTPESVKIAEKMLHDYPDKLEKDMFGECWFGWFLHSSGYSSRFSIPVYSKQIDRALQILKKCKPQEITFRRLNPQNIIFLSDTIQRIGSVSDLPILNPQKLLPNLLQSIHSIFQTNTNAFAGLSANNFADSINQNDILNAIKVIHEAGQDFDYYFRLFDADQTFYKSLSKIDYFSNIFLTHSLSSDVKSRTPIYASL